MARNLRLQYPGAHYHVMARGNRREKIFHDDVDRRFFLKALSQACGMTGWRVHAWVLMANHYHLFIETPEPNLVAGMAWLQNTYTRRYNVRHRKWGRLFGDRYKAIIVDGEDAWHYQTLLDYIHLNPVRARLVRPDQHQSVLDYPWSSLAGGYSLPPRRRANWLAAETGLKTFDLPDSVAGRRRMAERLDERAVNEEASHCGVQPTPEEMDARCSHLRRGWYWGGRSFAERLHGILATKLTNEKCPKSRAYKHAPQTRSHDLGAAERYLSEGLAAAGLTAKDLAGLKGSDPRKVVIARLIWKNTTVSQVWIASRLHMSTATNVSQQIRRLEQQVGAADLPADLPAGLKHYLEAPEVASGKILSRVAP